MTSHIPESLGNYFVIKVYLDANHAGHMEIGGRILASSSMTILYLSSGTVNARIQLRLQVLDLILFPLGFIQRLLRNCSTS